jgi:hypothetical protein
MWSGEVQGAGEVSYLEYHCPDHLQEKFLRTPEGIDHRELFLFTGKLAEPVEGATCLAPTFTIGSANRSEFWDQRRPLLAYWGGSVRPARYMQMRFIKDDYDFSSALFFSVQSKNCVVFVVNFRSPGGDKHISLDPIRDGKFKAQRLRVRFDLAQVPVGAQVLVDGKQPKLPEPIALTNADGVKIAIYRGGAARQYPLDSRVAINLGGAFLGLRFHRARFGKQEPRLVLTNEGSMLTGSLDLLNTPRTQDVSWANIKEAFAARIITMSGTDHGLADFDRRFAALACDCKEQGGNVELTWKTPAGVLQVRGGTAIQTVDEQNSRAIFSIDGQPVPEVRLSNEKIAV